MHYSIGLAGSYRLHVGLRQQGLSLPGSPFDLHVDPGGLDLVIAPLVGWKEVTLVHREDAELVGAMCDDDALGDAGGGSSDDESAAATDDASTDGADEWIDAQLGGAALPANSRTSRRHDGAPPRGGWRPARRRTLDADERRRRSRGERPWASLL